jgi:hypothetical protein
MAAETTARPWVGCAVGGPPDASDIYSRNPLLAPGKRRYTTRSSTVVNSLMLIGLSNLMPTSWTFP